MADTKYVLEMIGITKSFPGVKALDGVQLKVRPGTVLALMGENGAGKSTLMKCLFGVYIEDSGEIYVDGVKSKFMNPKQAMDNGVAMVHQELQPIPERSVAENIFCGRYPMKWGGIVVDHAKMNEMTAELLKEVRLNVKPTTKLGDLSVSQMQSVEIAKAVSMNAKIIIMDEPTSSLTENEVEGLFTIIESLKAKGVAIIYISHKMAEIKRISDEITVMRDGQWVATKPAAELEMKDIIRLMVGRELTNQFPPKTNKPGEVLLKIENLTGQYNQLKNVSFEARKGEVLGIAGLDSSGRTETLESIFGIRTRKEGTITLHRKTCLNRDAGESIKNGFALLTEERRATGIFGGLSIKDNTVISSLHRHKRFGVYLSEKSQREDTQYYIDAMHTKTPSQETKIRTLSGGNQQKVIIGRWLLTEPEVLLLDEPTRGIDVGAKYEIYQLIINLANEGKGVMVVSSEMPELLGICDRIMVMSNGHLAGILDIKDATQEEIMRLAAMYV